MSSVTRGVTAIIPRTPPIMHVSAGDKAAIMHAALSDNRNNLWVAGDKAEGGGFRADTSNVSTTTSQIHCERSETPSSGRGLFHAGSVVSCFPVQPLRRWSLGQEARCPSHAPRLFHAGCTDARWMHNKFLCCAIQNGVRHKHWKRLR